MLTFLSIITITIWLYQGLSGSFSPMPVSVPVNNNSINSVAGGGFNSTDSAPRSPSHLPHQLQLSAATGGGGGALSPGSNHMATSPAPSNGGHQPAPSPRPTSGNGWVREVENLKCFDQTRPNIYAGFSMREFGCDYSFSLHNLLVLLHYFCFHTSVLVFEHFLMHLGLMPIFFVWNPCWITMHAVINFKYLVCESRLATTIRFARHVYLRIANAYSLVPNITHVWLIRIFSPQKLPYRKIVSLSWTIFFRPPYTKFLFVVILFLWKK